MGQEWQSNNTGRISLLTFLLFRSGLGGIRRRREGLLFCCQDFWIFLVHLNFGDLWFPFLSLAKEWYLWIFLKFRWEPFYNCNSALHIGFTKVCNVFGKSSFAELLCWFHRFGWYRKINLCVSSLSQNKARGYDGCEINYPVPVSNYGMLPYHNS